MYGEIVVLKINGKEYVFNSGTLIAEALALAGVVTQYDYVTDDTQWDDAYAIDETVDGLEDAEIVTVEYRNGGTLYSQALKKAVPEPVLGSAANPYTTPPTPKYDIKRTSSGRVTMTESLIKNENKKENATMKKNLFGNMGIEFGKVNDYRIKTTINGLGIVSDAGKLLVYNPADASFTDVPGELIVDFGADFIFAMPVAPADVKAGDLIKQGNDYYYVVETTSTGATVVINPANAKQEVLVPQKNIFGFNFVTKIVNMFAGLGANTATENNPFGGMMLPLLLSGGETDISDILMLSTLSGGNTDMNAMLPFLLMKGGDKGDMLPLLFMMQQNGGANPFAGLFGQAAAPAVDKKTKATATK